jgi:hypothetical protein
MQEGIISMMSKSFRIDRRKDPDEPGMAQIHFAR